MDVGMGEGPGAGRGRVVQGQCRAAPAHHPTHHQTWGDQCGSEPCGEMKYFAGDANSRLLTRDV